MRIQVFGDLHGRNNWKERVDLTADKIIFLGDYVDSFTISDLQIIQNLQDIIAFKKEHIHKVALLLGNHDLMYYFLGERLFQCTGFRASYANELHRLYSENKHFFQVAFQIDKGYIDKTNVTYLFTHAGLSRLFLKKLQKKIPSDIIKIEDNDYAKYLNTIFDSVPNYLADISFYRGGLENWGGIFWADMKEFSKDSYIKGLSQIVGHQPIENITIKEFGKDKIIWIDTESVREPIEEAVYNLEV